MNKIKNLRAESEIFSDLDSLSKKPGYIHVIAYLSFRDNVTRFRKNISAKDLDRISSRERLIRNEINSLIGCMVKADIDWSLPSPKEIQSMLDETQNLLEEYHQRMSTNAWGDLKSDIETGRDPLASGEAIREAIFYASESSYTFQFRDMAAERYAADAEWIRRNKGYDPQSAKLICKAIVDLQGKILQSTLEGLRNKHPSEWSLLDGFKLDVDEISSQSGITKPEVEAFLDAFTWNSEDSNEAYREIDDFNKINIKPIITNGDGSRYLLQFYPLVEATYDTPFYWFTQDKEYFRTAAKNRGNFTESFLVDRLKSIFGENSVFPNVDVYEGARRLSEIDCLVVFGEYALVFQAKSQRLTMPSRKGEKVKIEEDFKRAVQNAYNQAITCSQAINREGIRFLNAERQEIDLSQIERSYPICVLADHYPALSMQTRSFLEIVEDPKIGQPLVCDLFLIDVITEMLTSPLRFLSYITMRTHFGEKIVVTNELSAFGFFINNNLWVEDGVSMLMLDDSVSFNLDIAMAVRREGLPGPGTPDGVLTRLVNTRLGKIISQIEHEPNQFSVGVGLAILEMSEGAVKEISSIIDRMINNAARNHRHHDMSIPLENRDAGLTIHVNNFLQEEAEEKLRNHMVARKYTQKAQRWYGLLIEPGTGNLKLGLKLDAPHVFDYNLEAITSNAPPLMEVKSVKMTNKIKRKVGRNDMCLCGSQKKYKKCCLNVK